MYTSGSTGLPKASLIRQRSVTRVVKNTNYVHFDPSDRVLQLSNYAFDGSVFDIFGALLNGARLVIVDRDESRDVDRLASRIRSHGITTFFCTTSLFNVLVDTAVDALASVRAIVIGGERASPPHVLRAFRALGPGRVINGYGPTETTVFATAYCVDQIHESDSFVPIGRPLANTAVFIVDRQGHLQPMGAKGEIWVAGDGVAAGYLNRPELTTERFVRTPLWNDGPVYRTGDIGRWLADGNIEYLGRNDDQVKIRGFRIEPEEVVAALNACAPLRECVVVARENDIGEKYLAAYYVADEAVDVEQLRKRLGERIPSYMSPSFFIRCDAIPLTANGKVNKAALPAATRDTAGFGRSYVAPVTDLEETVAAACREIFEIDSIGTQDNFFEAGGNSILIMRLNNRLKKVLGREIAIATVFQYPTVASLSAYLGRPQGVDSGRDEQDRMARAKSSLQSTVNRFARRKTNEL
jgi:acyl-coenzyme A synthetase/AMP-(fatty) acid ligase/aryl carrier-like protein